MKIDITKLPEGTDEMIEEWLKSEYSRLLCPWEDLDLNCNSRENYIGAGSYCKTIFPSLETDITKGNIIYYCPCVQFENSYVRRRFKEILKRLKENKKRG